MANNYKPRKPRNGSSGNKHASSSPKSGRSRKTRNKKSVFGRYAVYIWTGIILVAVAYVGLFYYFFVSPYSFRWKAIYGEPEYPDGYNVRGIDISHYQTSIKWDKLRNASLNNDPVRFVIIKATEGKDLFDDDFNDNFFQAKENDFIRGAYHFFVPGVDAAAQARFFLHQVHLVPGDLPPVLDIEKTGKLSKKQLQNDVKKWLDIVEKKYGVKPILYTSYKFKKDYLDDPVFNEYPYWIAHYYINKLEYKGDWVLWQHTDCGKVDGITGFVDCNIFNGTIQDLEAFTIKDREEDLQEAEL
ncbi:MAG: glycoside hydrolase family 25 protein [Bacteroidaceae bacterium]|nr:glycoside hydrolase family 25 protein [Bacteroidaceae bacterium]